jgi:DNA-binding SARP family transcriptional activator/predicted ATPase
MPETTINVLGPLEISLDGKPVSFSYVKLKALLVYLCVERNQPLARTRLAGILWPDQSQSAAQDSLRQAIARLRYELKDRDRHPPILMVERDSIQLNPHNGLTCDLYIFQEITKQTVSHHHRSLLSCVLCASLYEDAARLIRGGFLEDFYLPDSDLFEDWLSIIREHIRNQELEVLGNLAQFYDRQGDNQKVLEYTGRLIAIDPYNEPAYRLMMLNLTRSGQRSQAVVIYNKLQEILHSELGISPTADTQGLLDQIKTEQELPGPFRHEVYGLPAPVTTLVGREVELAELGVWLSDPDRRLINVFGPGGIGKTRLTIQATHRAARMFANEVIYVNLAAPDPSLALADAIASTLGLSIGQASNVWEDITAYFNGRESLLVLDGFEYFLPECQHISQLLEAHSGLVVLVTSRERLNLPGEWIFELGGLDVPPPVITEQLEAYSSVLLFCQTARQVSPSFTLTDSNRLAVSEICRLVGGIPLAIQLAAAWTRSLPCQEIASEIQHSLDILSRHPVTKSGDKEESIRAVFEQSWNRLDPSDQVIFQRLSVFRLGFDQDAAWRVAEATAESLCRLVDHSLVRMGQEERYDLHDLLIQYGAEKLRQSGEEKVVHQHHFEYYYKRAMENDLQLKKEGKLTAFIWLIREAGNLAEALNWSRRNAPEYASEVASWAHFDYHQFGMHLIDQKTDLQS